MNMGGIDQFYEWLVKEGKFETVGDFATLYNLAYLGKKFVLGSIDEPSYAEYYDFPVLEVKDSSKIFFRNRSIPFCYSLIVPRSQSTKEYMMQSMQRDLKNYFRYEVVIETRKMPIWQLVATEEAKTKLKTKGGPEFFKSLWNAGTIAQNVPVKSLVRLISSSLGNGKISHFIILNATGIEGNIDIDLSDCLISDINDLKRNLQANGLDLVQGQKDMKVIVIRDQNTYYSRN
jgi:hypothetical protein